MLFCIFFKVLKAVNRRLQVICIILWHSKNCRETHFLYIKKLNKNVLDFFPSYMYLRLMPKITRNFFSIQSFPLNYQKSYLHNSLGHTVRIRRSVQNLPVYTALQWVDLPSWGSGWTLQLYRRSRRMQQYSEFPILKAYGCSKQYLFPNYWGG